MKVMGAYKFISAKIYELSVVLIVTAVLNACSPQITVQPSLDYPSTPLRYVAPEDPRGLNYYLLTSKNFHLRGYLSPDLGQAVIKDLEHFRMALLDFHGVDITGPERPLDIIFVEDEYYQAFQVGEVSIAFYSDGLMGPKIVVNSSRLKDDYSEFWRVLFHEYVHHFNASYIGYRTPIWMNEGRAEYLSSFERLDGGTYRFADFENLAGDNLLYLQHDAQSWIPMDRYLKELTDYPILPGYYGDAAQKRQTYFYAQAWLLEHWLRHTERGKSVALDLAARLDKGEDLTAAFPDDIQAALEAYAAGLKPLSEEHVLSSGQNFAEVESDESRLAEMDMLASIMLMIAIDTGGASKDSIITNLFEVFEDDGTYQDYYLAAQSMQALHNGESYDAYLMMKEAVKAGQSNPDVMRLGASIFIKYVGAFPRGRVDHANLTIETIEKAQKLRPGDVGLDLDRLVASGQYGQRHLPVNTSSLTRVLDRQHHKRNPLKATSMVTLLLNSRNFDIAEDVIDRSRIWIPADRAEQFDSYIEEVREDIRLGRKFMAEP